MVYFTQCTLTCTVQTKIMHITALVNSLKSNTALHHAPLHCTAQHYNALHNTPLHCTTPHNSTLQSVLSSLPATCCVLSPQQEKKKQSNSRVEIASITQLWCWPDLLPASPRVLATSSSASLHAASLSVPPSLHSCCQPVQPASHNQS